MQNRQRNNFRLYWLIIIIYLSAPDQRKYKLYQDDSRIDHDQVLMLLLPNVQQWAIKLSLEALTLTTRFRYGELCRLLDFPESFMDQCID